MAKQIYTNRASSLLVTNPLNPGDLSLTVSVGEGALFPNPGATEYFLATLEDATGATEIIKVTARVADTFTIVRGQEGTAAGTWTGGVTRVELRTTRGTLEQFVQRDGDSMTGPLAMSGQAITDPVISGAGAKMTNGEIVNVPLRGATGDAANEVRVPTDSSRATAGGSKIALQSEINLAVPIGTIVMWGLGVGAIPAGWNVCDGGTYNSVLTPNLIDKFILAGGYGASARAQHSVAGGVAGVTGAGGAHTPVAQGTALTEAQGAVHSHEVLGCDEDQGGISSPLTGNRMLACASWVQDAVWVASSVHTALSAFGVGTYKFIKDSLGGSTHTHTMDAVPTHTHVAPVVDPTNIAVIFIMKTLNTV